MSRRFRERYGAGPLHLLSGLTALALSGYAILELFHRARPLEIGEWLIAAILIHDLVLLPFYSLVSRVAHRGLGVGMAGREQRVEALNHLRIAVFFVVLPLLIWAPLIFGLANTRYVRNTGQTTDVYLGRWLLYSGAVCVGSALLYVIRGRQMRLRLRRHPDTILEPPRNPDPDPDPDPDPGPNPDPGSGPVPVPGRGR